MSEWQPIATAPEDGTFVLLCGGRPDCHVEPECFGRPVVALWIEDDAMGGGWYYAYWDSDWRSAYEKPTHWMPLPPPPSL